MKTLDRYIARQFLINFAILLAVLMTLFVVVDFIVNQDEFFEAGRVRADTHGGVILATLFSIVDYYGPIVILAYVFFVGLLVVAAMGFTMAALERHRELIALAAGGVSLYRVAAPVMVVGFATIALVLPIQELVIPPLADKLARGPGQVKAESLESFRIDFARDEQGNLLSARRFDPGEQTLEDVSILVRGEDGRALSKIKADVAVWDADAEAWAFPTTGYAVSVRDRADPLERPMEPEPIEAYATELSPTVLTVRRAAIYARLLGMGRLQQMQASAVLDPAERSEVTQIIWSRFSLVAVHGLLLAMTLGFFLSLIPGSMLLQGVKASVVALAAWGVSLVVLQVPAAGLSPVTAAWLPVVVLLPLAAILLQFVKT